MNNELTIVVPVKNEERLIGRLLDSICRQDYEHIRRTQIYIADAASTDATLEVVRGYTRLLPITIIPGGLPAAGRNAGARMARSKYILFIDADIELGTAGLIRRAVERMKRHRLHCLTTCILSKEKRVFDNLMYGVNALLQLGSKYSRPFSPGAFTLFDRERFNELGGFDERVLYAEDYFLSKNVAGDRFGIVPGYVFTTNRRFKKMGYFKFIRLFIKTVVNSHDDAFFFQDHRYWE